MRNPRAQALRNFLLGGLLPLGAYVLVESIYGTKGGLIAGVVFGVGEIVWEKWRQGRVQGITWIANFLVVVLGGVSLYEDNGVFFKLQPAVFLLLFALLCIGSSWFGRPFLVELAKKQNPHLPPEALPRLQALNFRLGLFFFLLTALSVHSALYWSTAAWAALKAVGLPVLLGLYILGEMVFLRWRNKPQKSSPTS